MLSDERVMGVREVNIVDGTDGMKNGDEWLMVSDGW